MTRNTKHRSMILMAVIAAGLTACGTGDADRGDGVRGWPSMGMDHSNSVRNRAESTISVDNVANLAEAWRAEVGGVTGTPAVVGGRVYFGDWLGVVYSLAADDGWSLGPNRSRIHRSALR